MIVALLKIVGVLIGVQIVLLAIGSVFAMFTSLRDRRSNKRVFAEIQRSRVEEMTRDLGSKTRLVSFKTRPDK